MPGLLFLDNAEISADDRHHFKSLSRLRGNINTIFFFCSQQPRTTNGFLLFDPFIVSVFVQRVRTKAVTSHLFTPFSPFHHLPLIHFAPPLRLLIDFKNSKKLTYFCILLCINMHLILFLSPDWLIFCHMIISLIKNSLGFLSPSDEGPTLETLDFTIRIASIPTFL